MSPLTRSRRIVLGGGGSLLGVLAGAIYVFAGHGTGTVASYTGCLNPSGGTVYSLASGEMPLKPCNAGHPQIHLSGGDITDVAAGAGLSGGGEGGAVSLTINSTEVQSRVFGDCDVPGGAISKVEESGAVVCSSGPLVLHTFTAGPFDVANETAGPVGSLPLPAGTYLVIAKLFLKATDPLAPGEDYINTACSLHPSDDPSNRDEAVLAGDIDFEAGGALTMVHAFALTAPGSADVTCRDFGNTLLVADTEWNDLRLTAFRLGSLVVFP